jgi:alpha-glucosidase
MKQIYFLLIAVVVLTTNVLAKAYKIQSPDKSIKLAVTIDNKITYSVWYKSLLVTENNAISMQVEGFKTFGEQPVVKSVNTKDLKETITATVPYKNSLINDECQQLTIQFKDNYSLFSGLITMGSHIGW